ncbi:hypothetical protein N7466_011060 [Penicillium verhagenii]|uniref:uncharacterized protein n=1 Tax=Penicillium verhagenii TaxID=1562060 RepID=UPI00254541EE|nr:uncharacterized protein N7466_011060 [Penicillium verhagenii]KAJ5917506.1 hypothetical protein N7466_011060 [Penicillium verhagenii]
MAVAQIWSSQVSTSDCLHLVGEMERNEVRFWPCLKQTDDDDENKHFNAVDSKNARPCLPNVTNAIDR